MSWRERWLWCLAVGAATSSAASVKWTALATPGACGSWQRAWDATRCQSGVNAFGE